MTTAKDLIERSYLRLTSGISQTFVQFGAIVNASTQGAMETVTLSGVQLSGVMSGSRISSGLEIMLITTWSPTTNTAQVIRGYNGSQAVAHALNDVAYLDPEFTYFDILQALNDDMRDLSSPANGLFRVGNVNITYVPSYMGYDLGGISSDFLEVLRVVYQEASPVHKLPTIAEWEVNRTLSDTYFPSGQGLVVYQEGFPGQQMMIQYSGAFLPLVNLTDGVELTPTANDPNPPYNGWGSTTVTPNLPTTMTDIPVLGALIRLTQPREIQRNDMGAQPEPRKALDVPFGSVAGSVNSLVAQRQMRIKAESARLRKQYAHRRR